MENNISSLRGKIAAFINGGASAIVRTELGDAYIDCNTDIDIHLRVGDEICIEEAEFYILNGKIFTMLQGIILVNNIKKDCG